jgi:hypothetical protein
MSKKIGWNHPIDFSDLWNGFNDSGIEHFTGSPIPHLAREVNQNSVDSGNGETVKVVIKCSGPQISDSSLSWILSNEKG